MDAGTKVWIKTKEAAVWAPGEVVDCQPGAGLVQVRRLDTDDLVLRTSRPLDSALHCLN
jgi:hypothetical protein